MENRESLTKTEDIGDETLFEIQNAFVMLAAIMKKKILVTQEKRLTFYLSQRSHPVCRPYPILEIVTVLACRYHTPDS